MNNAVKNIVDHIWQTSSDVDQLVTPLKKLDIPYFTFLRVYQSGARVNLTNVPHVIETYLSGDYYRIGNTEGVPTQYQSKIVVWDTLEDQTLFNSCPRPHGFDHGIHLIQANDDYCDFFGLAAVKGNDLVMNTYFTQLDYLKKFTQEFTEKADGLIQTTVKKNLILPFNEKIADSYLEGGYWVDELKNHLTKRQMEIAAILLQGKNIKEIGRKLNLSPRTVETHLNHMKQKMNCKNKINLVLALAKMLG